MDVLAQLGVALGLASLAGVNLYLTVLLTGLAVRFHWVELAGSYHSLDVLGHPLVLVVAGLLFAMQFLADKIPWVDSLWDSVHTVIRPVGGTLLALQALGSMPGYIQVAAALLAGGAALTTHSAKAGTRLLINHSPEPVTNVVMSLAEESAVAGGVALTLIKPVVALMVFAGLIAFIWLIYPRLWRLIRTSLWLAWHKLKLPGRSAAPEKPITLGCEIDSELRDLLQIGAGLSPDEVAWTVPCHSGRAKGVRGLSSNLRGVLVAPARPDCVYFGAVKGWRPRLLRVPLADVEVKEESRFLSEDVVVTAKGLKAVFRFARGQGRLAEAVAEGIRELLKRRPEPVVLGQAPLPDSLQASPMESESAPVTSPEPAPAPPSEPVPEPEKSLAPAEPLPALGEESSEPGTGGVEIPSSGEVPVLETNLETAPDIGLGEPDKPGSEPGEGLPPLPVIGSK